MADIFFSYQHDDRSLVEPIVHILEARGFSVLTAPPNSRLLSI
jgi:hypothetical protein